MAGIEDVVVEWAISVAPLDTPAAEDWTVLPHWQSIKTSGGQTIDDVTQVFNVGTATIRLRNGDTIGHTPMFSPTASYRGRHIRVTETVTLGVNIFEGRIDRVEYHYENTPFAGFATLHCVDTVGNVSDVAVPDELVPGEPPVDYFTQVFTVEQAVSLILAEMSPVFVLTVDGEFSHQLVKAPDKFESRQGLLDFLNQVLLTEGAALYALPDQGLHLRGRWNPLRLLSADADDPIVFTDSPPPYDDLTFRYRRDGLEWTDTDADNVNSVQTRSKYLAVTHTEENVASGFPKMQLSRTELPTVRQGWVEADARMWFNLYNQSFGYPKRLKFMVASRGSVQRNVLQLGGINVLANRAFHVLHTPPGDTTQRTYRVIPDYMENDIDRQRWLCALGFTSLDRWWNAYSNGTDPIEMIEIDGDAAHGIGSDAIIAP